MLSNQIKANTIIFWVRIFKKIFSVNFKILHTCYIFGKKLITTIFLAMLYYQSYSRTEHQPRPEKNYNTWPHRHSRSNTDNDIKKIFQQLQTIQPTQTKPLSAAIKPQRQHCRIKQQFCLLFIAYIFGYLSFLVAGGFIFSWLETRSHPTNQRPSLLDIKTNFLAKHSSVSGKLIKILKKFH